jgi:hypothetical protein
MEWTIRREARTGWGEVTSYEIGVLRRGLHDLRSERVGLPLAEAKALLAELQQRIVQDQVAEYVTCARACPDCMALRRLRDQRTRTLQTLFGTVTVAAPRIRLCSCADTLGMADLSFSPLADVLPERCTAELCQLHAELGARHSFAQGGAAARDLYAVLATQSHQRAKPAALRFEQDRSRRSRHAANACCTSASPALQARGDHRHDRRGTPACRASPEQPPRRRDGRQGGYNRQAAAAFRVGPDGHRAASAGHHGGAAGPGLAA